MRPAQIALAGIALTIAGAAGIGFATRESRFPLRLPDHHPSIISVQISHSDTELRGLVRVNPDDATPCRMVTGRLQANLNGDMFFPVCYGAGYLAIAWFVLHSPPRKRATAAFAAASVSILATLVFDYRENAITAGVLSNLCSAFPAPAATEAMRAASLDKWGALGISLLLLWAAAILKPTEELEPANEQPANWFATFGAIRTLAALTGGIAGIAAYVLADSDLPAVEFNCFSIVALATLWQAARELTPKREKPVTSAPSPSLQSAPPAPPA